MQDDRRRPRIRPVGRDSEDPATAALLEAVESAMGAVPAFIAAMATSPAVARAYLEFARALSAGALAPPLRERIALAVSEANGCAYCVSAHTALGLGLGLEASAALDARRGRADDPRARAGLVFARTLVAARGRVGDDDVDRVRRAGFSDGEIGEIVAHVALNTFTNYFNLVAGTVLDFPPAPPLVSP